MAANNANRHLPVLPASGGFGSTLRTDTWWVGPALTVLILLSFSVYATFRAFENAYYTYRAYLSPFYSPLFDTSWAKSLPGPIAGLVTPALLILPGPLSFRFTCYYYRKAYYRSFAMDPPACAVGERGAHRYNGESKLLLFQNLHRYAMYLAVVFIVILWKDAIEAFMWSDGFHVGVGTLVMLTNVLLLSGYTFGCHSFRHFIGGSVNSYSTASMGGLRYRIWQLVSKLNARHMVFAWCSLFSVGLTDLYIRSVSSGAIPDIRIF
jgi:hypothetical protein